MLVQKIDPSLDDDNVECSLSSPELGPIKCLNSDLKILPEVRELESISDNVESCGSSSEQREGSTDDEAPVRRLISKPIVDGKTYTTILYEVIASMDTPFTIKYFQVDSNKPRTRGGRFIIECHLDDTLYGTGEGPSKKAAKQIASEVALDKLVEEFPRLTADVDRVKAGFPSRKKLRTRRRPTTTRPQPTPRERAQAWRSRKMEQDILRFSDPLTNELARDLHERRRFALEYEQVRDLVRNIDSLTTLLGRSRDMSLYESDTMSDYLSYEEYQDYQRSAKLLETERDMGYIDPFRMYESQPDTRDFMRKMQRSRTDPKKLNHRAKEFKPSFV